MFANVVVFSPTDPTKKFFTYKVPNKLSKGIATGLLVSVPWGRKITQGLIVEILKETKVENPKKILKLLSDTPILLPNYIELLKWMSWYYHASMLDCLKTILPDISRLPRQKLNFSQKRQKNIKQTVILLPNINQMINFYNKFKTSKGKLIYHKLLAKDELWKLWFDIYLGKATTIIGTRMAVFTPCPNLTKIIIVNEEDPAFKDVQSPYFDTLTVAEKLAEISNAKLKIESLTPRVETWFKFPKKIIKPKIKPKMTIVDLAEIKKTKEKSNLSDTLINILIEKVSNNRNILLFLNRTKESGQIYCAECKFSGFSASAPTICPNCRATKINFYHLNLKLIGDQVVKIVPGAGIKIIKEGKVQIVKKGKPIITLATNAIFSQMREKFSFIAVVSADTILNLPDFNSSFRTFSTIIKLSQKADDNCDLLIQTYNSKHPAIKLASEFDFDNFYHQELVLRKKLELPPYSTLAKLTLKMKSLEKVQLEAEKLKQTLQTKSLLVEISDPVQNWQNRSEFNIILKAKKRQELDSLLPYVPVKWKVVIDPESLL